MELIDNGGDCGTEEALAFKPQFLPEMISLYLEGHELRNLTQFLAHYNCQSVL